MGLADILSSVIGGGVTGLFGVAVQRFADFKNKQLDIELNKQKMAHEANLRKLDAEIMAQEWASRTQIALTESATKEVVADSHAFAASFNLEPKRYSDPAKVTTRAQAWLFILLDFIRGVVRPGLTIYLCVLTTMIYFSAREIMGEEIPPERAADLLSQIVNTILYLTTTCLLWWFGVRNKQPAHGLKR